MTSLLENKDSERPVAVTTTDIVYADHIMHSRDNPGMMQFLAAHNITDKSVITKELSDQIKRQFKIDHTTAGGSAVNTFTTLSEFADDKPFKLTIIGVTGNDADGELIKRHLKEFGIDLVTPLIPEGITPETSQSFVFVDDETGKRVLTKYYGNASKIINADALTEELANNTDIFMVQGSTRRKFPALTYDPVTQDNLTLADKMIDRRWKNDKQLWETMPTGENVAQAERNVFRWHNTSTDITLSNSEEIRRVYTQEGKELISLDDALHHLQQHLADSRKEKENPRVWEKDPSPTPKTIFNKGPMAFVTTNDGCYVVRETGDPKFVSRIEHEHPVNDLGAGDCAYGGMLYGVSRGYSDEVSAHMGMAAANMKVGCDTSNIPREVITNNPKNTLSRLSPFLAMVLSEGSNHPDRALSPG